MTRGSILGRCNECYSSSKRPNYLWGPLDLAFRWCQLCFSLKRREPEVVEVYLAPPLSRRDPDRDGCILSHVREKAIYIQGASLLLSCVYMLWRPLVSSVLGL